MKYTDKQILDKVKSLPDFKQIPKDEWIVFIRSKFDAFDQFDDYAFRYKGEVFQEYTTCTTNPGGSVLLGGWKKYTKIGAAIIKSDQWMYDAFKYGLHNWKMPALRQCKNVLYHRDANNDRKVDETSKVYNAIYNTNIHFSNHSIFQKVKLAITKFVGNWSAGCLVFNVQDPYERMITACKNQPFVTAVILKEF